MHFTLVNDDYWNSLVSDPVKDYGSGMFSPYLHYLGGSIYLFGAPSGFGKTFLACGEACKFANQGYRTAYIHTEMSDKQIVLNRLSHCVEIQDVVKKGTLVICGTDVLEDLSSVEDTTLELCDVIILDYVCNMALTESTGNNASTHVNLSNYMKSLDNYRKQHPNKLFLVYAQICLNHDDWHYEDEHNLRRSVDVSLMLTPVSYGTMSVKCDKSREGTNQYEFCSAYGAQFYYTWQKVSVNYAGKVDAPVNNKKKKAISA